MHLDELTLYKWHAAGIHKIYYIRKEFLSRLNQIYYWILLCTTHEHYNTYLTINIIIWNEKNIQKIIMSDQPN